MYKIRYQFSKKIKSQKGAALIIALVIVTVATTMILGVGRTMVSSTFTSTRYGDTITANNLAWSGIEEGLMKYKKEMQFCSSNNVADCPAGVPAGNNLSIHYPTNFVSWDYLTKVVRRNLNPKDSTEQTIGESDGIDYTQDIINTDPQNYNWNYNDYFNDLRIWSTNLDIGPDNLPSVNINSDGNIIRNNKYFKVPQNKSETSPYWRIFDLKDYTGDSSTYKINFKYTANSTGNIIVDFFIKYKGEEYITAHDLSNDWGDGLGGPPDGICDAPVWARRTLNKKLCNVVVSGTCTKDGVTYDKFFASGCYDKTNAPYGYYDDFQDNGHYSSGNYYINDNHTLPAGTSGIVPVYIPPPKNGSVGGNVEYLAIKFTFSIPNDSITYGFYQDSTGTGFLGQGMTNIISTGIYNNIRKTIEIWASKNLKLNEDKIITSPEYTNVSNPLECKNSTSTILSTCLTTVYRDNKY